VYVGKAAKFLHINHKKILKKSTPHPFYGNQYAIIRKLPCYFWEKHFFIKGAEGRIL
jgi:hypothetical protein